eukprot:431851_1
MTTFLNSDPIASQMDKNVSLVIAVYIRGSNTNSTFLYLVHKRLSNSLSARTTLEISSCLRRGSYVSTPIYAIFMIPVCIMVVYMELIGINNASVGDKCGICADSNVVLA